MPAGRNPGEGWHDLAEHVAETLDVGPGTRVFEVDCGDGEFLFPLYSNGYIVGGTDRDPLAVARAREVMPEGVFSVGAASALDPAVPWDVIVCRSVGTRHDTSLTPTDANHVRGLIARMFAKATHAIALLDVPETIHPSLLHALAEAGAAAIQIDGGHVFARV